MNPYIYLVMIIAGIICFYIGNETLAVLPRDATGEPNFIVTRFLFALVLGGTMLIIFGVFGALDSVNKSLYAVTNLY
jgi:hypothetical protein